MDNDLKHVTQKWRMRSVEIETYLSYVIKKCVQRMEKKYKLWNTEQVIQWIQYILKDKVIFDKKDIEVLKIANIAGINIHHIKREILRDIRITDEISQNIVVTAIHSLISKYSQKSKYW